METIIQFAKNPSNRILLMQEIIRILKSLDSWDTGYFICNVINNRTGEFRQKHNILQNEIGKHRDICVGTLGGTLLSYDYRLADLLPELLTYKTDLFPNGGVWFFSTSPIEERDHINQRIEALSKAIADIEDLKVYYVLFSCSAQSYLENTGKGLTVGYWEQKYEDIVTFNTREEAEQFIEEKGFHNLEVTKINKNHFKN